MLNPRKIAAGLTPAMKKGMLADRSRGEDAYSMRVSRITLQALASRGLVKSVGGVGAMFSPDTTIKWPLTGFGQEVLKALQEQNNG